MNALLIWGAILLMTIYLGCKKPDEKRIEERNYDEEGRLKSYEVIHPTGEMPDTLLRFGWNGRLAERIVRFEGYHSKITKYYPSGGPMEEYSHVMGMKEGEACYYWGDHRIKRIEHYKQGHLHGELCAWYATGAEEVVMMYSDGLPCGKQFNYVAGKLDTVITHERQCDE